MMGMILEVVGLIPAVRTPTQLPEYYCWCTCQLNILWHVKYSAYTIKVNSDWSIYNQTGLSSRIYFHEIKLTRFWMVKFILCVVEGNVCVNWKIFVQLWLMFLLLWMYFFLSFLSKLTLSWKHASRVGNVQC